MSTSEFDFIVEFQDDVLRYCYFLSRDEVGARDLAQETFLKALSAKQIPHQGKAYLFRIAKNLFIDLKRKSKSEDSYTRQIVKEESTAPPVDLGVWQALFSLSSEDQEILLLVDREELSLDEAADLIGISLAAAKSRLFRARENFKNKWNS